MNTTIWVAVGCYVEHKSNFYKEIIAMNSLLTDKYSNTLVFSSENIPHLNLFDLNILREMLPLALKRLKDIAKKTHTLTLKLKNVLAFPFGTFFIEIEKQSELLTLHAKIVHAIAPLKNGCLCNDYLKHRKTYTREQRKLLQRYGSPHVLKNFTPHITIGHVEKEDNSKICKSLNALRKTESTVFHTLHLFKEDDTLEVVKRFPLQ
ncbi:MAG: 2'-5' RNA ligase family protein [Nanoarchaeota archaeon]